ncbi:MAG: hypothetical protein NC821_00310 [Candidatus Omnitrophica bacterium]|nr:hypothetical protein [Candidatus Omnitrophota bacterium]
MRQIFRTLLTSIFVLLLFVLAIAVFYLASEKKKLFDQYNKDRELWTIRNNTLRETVKKSEEEIARLKEELEKLNGELKNANNELTELKTSYENLKNENFSLTQKISEYLKEKERLGQKIFQLEQDLKLAQEAQKAKMSEQESWANLLKEKADLQMRINELENRLGNNHLLLTQLEAERNKLEAHLKEVQQDKINIEQSLGEEGVKTVSPRDILKANLDKENMEKKLADLALEKEDLENRINSLKEEINRTESERGMLNSQMERVNQLLEEKLSEVNRVREELENALKEAKRIALSNTPSPVELPPVVVKQEEGEKSSAHQILPSPIKFSPPRTEQANVVLFNEKYNFVILNIGRRDGVMEGMLFDLYENKTEIGRVRIKEVRERLSAGEVIEIEKNKKIDPQTTTAIYSP